MKTTTKLPTTLEVTWVEPRKFRRDEVNAVQVLQYRDDNQPNIFAIDGKIQSGTGGQYPPPQAKATRKLLDVFEAVRARGELSAHADPGKHIVGSSVHREGLRAGEVRVRFTNAEYQKDLQTVVLSADSEPGASILRAAVATQARSLSDFDASLDGEVVRSI
jgi:hypothetical protein